MLHSRILAAVIAIVAVLPILGMPNTASADPCGCITCLGDINGDKTVAGDEIARFVDCLLIGSTPGGDCDCADLDGSGSPDIGDTSLFVAALLAPPSECSSQGSEPPNGRVGNPMRRVYLFNGEFFEQATDLRIKGRGLDFAWSRKYRSRTGPDTAQGNGWDFSYNIFLEQSGADLILNDGRGRRDRYDLQLDGTWTRPEFFRVINQNPDTSFTVTFPDKSTWNLNPIDGSVVEGKIDTMVDRAGNLMSFQYDAQGRLLTVHDSLDTPAHNRDITIAYDGSGHIQSVTDYIGRVVTYAYYDGIVPGGNLGDLKSVTTPPVNATPHGNDFPSGKTTVFTYSTGAADERLNHNLLTITDPKGQTFLTNTYAATIDPNALDYDRLTRQAWGDSGDILDVSYAALTPAPANNFATLLAAINDRVGNVTELWYDKGHRCVRRRQYTGRAPDPDAPTTQSVNLPTGKLRPSDPSFFETDYEWNCDSLLTRVVHPNLNEILYQYDEANPSRRSCGNLLGTTRLPGPLSGDQVQIVETLAYNPVINWDHNFVTAHTDGRGKTTSFEYDAAGNRTHAQHRIPSVVEDWEYNAFGQMTAHVLPDNGGTHRRRDEFSYHAAGPQRGYLQSAVVDAGGFNLTTGCEYDDVGNVTRMVDPRNHDALYIYNALDQVVRRISREVTAGGGVRYERDTSYDANDNIVQIDIQNRDDAGVLQVNTHFTTLYEFEILNYTTRATREIDPGDNIVTEYEYDENRNSTLTHFGEATNGTQLDNVVETVYDERDLLFLQTRAPGAVGPGGKSTDQVDYDGNGNVARAQQGIENAPRITDYAYDGYDRHIATLDPMGNTATFHYDANGNRTSEQIDGELTDVPGSVTNVRLWQAAHLFDDLDRLARSDVEFFDTATQAPINVGPTPDGKVTTVLTYNDNSQLLTVRDDNLNVTTTTYNTANRRSVITDAKNNTVTYGYDSNSNIVSRTDVDKSDLANPDEAFVTSFMYDDLDRLIQAVDNVGNITEHRYDSRSNRTQAIDTMRPLPGDPGNVTRYTYDGTNRLIQTERFMTADGTGTGAAAGSIISSMAWDDSNRLASRTDGNANVTSFAYDALNRLTATNHADTTVHAHTYDVHDNRISVTDANGSVQTHAYDALDRLTGRTIVRGASVLGTTTESYEYDGRNRLVSATDNDSTVTRGYDSISRVTTETLNTQTTTTLYDGVGNQLTCTYPGGRVITCSFDALNREKTISDGGGLLATYEYIGRARVEHRLTGPGGGITESAYQFDGIRRMTHSTHSRVAPPTVFDDRSFAWNQMSDNIQRSNLLPGGDTFDYGYDSVHRLVHSDKNAGAMLIDYDLDDVGDRVTVTGGPAPGTYTKDPTAPLPADYQMNQYTSTPLDTTGRLYDQNGNLITIDDTLPAQRDLDYDYRDQMVRHTDTGPSTRTLYKYDVLGRRIEKVFDILGTPVTTRYFYDGRIVVEEQDEFSATTATYVEGVGP